MQTDIELWWQRGTQSALAWWQSLGADGPYYLWLGLGIAGLLAWLFISHRVIRRLLGHRKFRGTWYNEQQFEVLLKVLQEDQQSGRRVMRHDELRLLRQWQFGGSGEGMFGQQANSYFS